MAFFSFIKDNEKAINCKWLKQAGPAIEDVENIKHNALVKNFTCLN
jgi:hypothetical protein